MAKVMAESMPSTSSRKVQMPRAVLMTGMPHVTDLMGVATESHNLLSMSSHSHEGKVVPIGSIGKEQPLAHKAIKGCRDQLNVIHIAARRDCLWSVPKGSRGGSISGRPAIRGSAC